MTLVVEVGQGAPNADSYVAVADCAAYAVSQGLTFPTDATGEAPLRVATAYIDNAYRLRFPGYRTFRRAQSREWPRTQAYYVTRDPPGDTPYFIDPRMMYPFDLIDPNSVPPEIVTATCEAAIRVFADPSALLPDLERGGQVYAVKAGTVQVRYGANAPANTTFQAIEAALSGLIGVQSAYSARATRI